MEKINTQPVETARESADKLIDAAIENAHGFYDALKEFEGTDVVGAAELQEVEELATNLSQTLRDIPAPIRLAEGLPYHPHEKFLDAA